MGVRTDSQKIAADALRALEAGFKALPEFESSVDGERLRSVLLDVADRLHDNYPYFHPLYAGQMLKPPHPVARLAYGLAQHINPNNHALDGGRASSAMEKEAVADIAAMFDWDEHLGHLTSGGTFANLEALWVAGQLSGGQTVLASSQAHYTHGRISEVLGLPFEAVKSDPNGKMDTKALQQRLGQDQVGLIVATLGTTSMGAVDPLDEILELAASHKVRVHVDAAYGGYFKLASNMDAPARGAFDHIRHADSIVVDPHKHGLQPYGCGCVLFRDPKVGRFYSHDSPYTYFSSSELHLGEISLECSRAGASAVALWATQRMLPLRTGGDFAVGLEQCREAALELFRRLAESDRWLTAWPPELDIVCWAPSASTASEISERSQEVFDRAAAADLHLALVSFPSDLLRFRWSDVQFDSDAVTCLRSCLMKPEHLLWLDRIWEILESATD